MKTIDRSIKNKSAFREVDKEQRQAKFLRQVFELVFQEGLETSYSHKIPVDISCIYTVSRLIYLMRQLRSISNVLTQSFSSFYTCLSIRSIKLDCWGSMTSLLPPTSQMQLRVPLLYVALLRSSLLGSSIVLPVMRVCVSSSLAVRKY